MLLQKCHKAHLRQGTSMQQWRWKSLTIPTVLNPAEQPLWVLHRVAELQWVGMDTRQQFPRCRLAGWGFRWENGTNVPLAKAVPWLVSFSTGYGEGHADPLYQHWIGFGYLCCFWNMAGIVRTGVCPANGMRQCISKDRAGTEILEKWNLKQSQGSSQGAISENSRECSFRQVKLLWLQHILSCVTSFEWLLQISRKLHPFSNSSKYILI